MKKLFAVLSVAVAALAVSACGSQVFFHEEPAGNVVTSTYPNVDKNGKETPNVVYTLGEDASGKQQRNPLRTGNPQTNGD